MMESVKITDAKAHFSALIQRVEAGEEIMITRRDKIIARIIPEKKPDISVAEALADIWRMGGSDLEPITDDGLPELDDINLD